MFVLAVIAVITIIAWNKISPYFGSNTLLIESPNKEQSKKAILFLNPGGATTSNSYQVTVSDYDHKFQKGEVGNTFTVDRNHGATGLDLTSINFKWLSNDTLQIDFDKLLRTFYSRGKS